MKNKQVPTLDRRFTLQMLFLGLALLASAADIAYIHYVCPVCGVITAQQLFMADIPIYLKLHNPAAVVVGAMAFTAVLFGPIFCGWVCPFGAYQDLISKIGTRTIPFRKKIQVPKQLEGILRSLRYVVLAAVVYMTAQGAVTVLENSNPYHSLLGLVKGTFAPVGFGLLLLVTVAALLIDRPWCRYLCPYGAVLGLSNRIKLFKVNRNEKSCVSCSKCSKACPMGIDVAHAKSVNQLSCISCYACTSKGVCPAPKTLSVAILPAMEGETRLMKSYLRILMTLAILVALAGAGFAATKLSGENANKQVSEVQSAKAQSAAASVQKSATGKIAGATLGSSLSNGKYKDGVYLGQSTGYQPGMEVQVTVKNNKIVDVSILNHNETPGFYEKAFAVVPTEIVSAQSTNVDTVSGATYSSKGIINAVKKALSGAVRSTSDSGNSTSVTSASQPAKGSVQSSQVVKKVENLSGKAPSVLADTSKTKLSAHSAVLNTGKNSKITKQQTSSHLEEDEYDEGDDEQGDDEQGENETSKGAVVQNAAPVSKTAASAPAKPVAKPSGLYKDGTYYGTATGYQPGLQVEVVVSGGRMTSIRIVSSQETPRFLRRVEGPVVGSILSAQNTQVDSVSGATYSSIGIKEAVKAALAKAK